MRTSRYGASAAISGLALALLLCLATLQGGDAQACQSSVSVSPWDTGNKFPDVTVCCGGAVNFQWSGNQGVYQLANGTCPATFVNDPTKDQKELLPVTQGSGGVKPVTFSVPGTFYLTSSLPGACDSGLLFKVTVPTCSAVPTAGGPSAFASGTPGGTSTSTSENSAASASGPPGTSQTMTAPGFASSMSG